MSELILRCGCEDGGDCTKMTICQAETYIEDMQAQVEELESDKRILMRETAQVRTNNVNNLKWIADLQAQVDRAVLALEPFAHPDLRRLLGGNAQGLESIVFQRNRAILRIGDFIQASTTKQALQEQKP